MLKVKRWERKYGYFVISAVGFQGLFIADVLIIFLHFASLLYEKYILWNDPRDMKWQFIINMSTMNRWKVEHLILADGFHYNIIPNDIII